MASNIPNISELNATRPPLEEAEQQDQSLEGRVVINPDLEEEQKRDQREANLKIDIPTLRDEDEEGGGLKTPTGEENKIPQSLECPPAPNSKRIRSSPFNMQMIKRRRSSISSFWLSEIDEFFSRI